MKLCLQQSFIIDHFYCFIITTGAGVRHSRSLLPQRFARFEIGH